MVCVKVGDIYINNKGEKCIIHETLNFGGKGKFYLVCFPLTNQYQYVFHQTLVLKKFFDSSKPIWNGCYSKGTLKAPAFTSDPDGKNIFYMWKMLINRRQAVTKQIYISPDFFDHMYFRRWALERYTFPSEQGYTIPCRLCTEDDNCYTPDKCFILVDIGHFIFGTRMFKNMGVREIAKYILDNHKTEFDYRNIEYLNRLSNSGITAMTRLKG